MENSQSNTVYVYPGFLQLWRDKAYLLIDKAVVVEECREAWFVVIYN